MTKLLLLITFITTIATCMTAPIVSSCDYSCKLDVTLLDKPINESIKDDVNLTVHH